MPLPRDDSLEDILCPTCPHSLICLGEGHCVGVFLSKCSQCGIVVARRIMTMTAGPANGCGLCSCPVHVSRQVIERVARSAFLSWMLTASGCCDHCAVHVKSFPDKISLGVCDERQQR
jgi:hypothetical protein